MATRPTRSERENALLAAARREAAARQAAPDQLRPASGAAVPKPPTPGAALLGDARLGGAVPGAIPAAPNSAARGAAPAEQAAHAATASVEQRLAVLMAAAQGERERRAQSHRRWKIAVGMALALVLLWTLAQFAHFRH